MLQHHVRVERTPRYLFAGNCRAEQKWTLSRRFLVLMLAYLVDHLICPLWFSEQQKNVEEERWQGKEKRCQWNSLNSQFGKESMHVFPINQIDSTKGSQVWVTLPIGYLKLPVDEGVPSNQRLWGILLRWAWKRL